MKFKAFVTLAAVGVGLSSLLAEPAGAAPYTGLARFGDDDNKSKKAKPKDKPKAGKKEKQAPVAAGEIRKRVALAPKGLRFGMSLESIAKLYDRIFDQEFLPLYKKAQPGMQMQTLDAELADKKALLRRNEIKFGRLPTGEDQGPRKGEYSYNNGESMSRVTLKTGTTRFVYLFSDELWKVYDEHKLRARGPLGANYKEALQILTKKFGVNPVVSQADFAKGRNFEEAAWKDATTIIRAVNRGPVLAMVYVDRKVQENIASYRKHRAEDPHEMDKEVAAVTRKADPEPDKKKEAAKKGDKKKKK